jgi:ABC-type uncharacterized transport system substrate-binding protein
MGGKILEVLKEVAPQVSRVAVLLDLEQPPHVALWRAIEATAQSFGVRLTPADVQGPAEIENAIEALARESNGALVVLSHHQYLSGTDCRVSCSASPSYCLRVSFGVQRRGHFFQQS